MSKYQLTEAYGELYNQRLTEASFYDNLRFVDYLQQEEIEEVMESLIWEFMDYGDSLDEAVDTLESIFEDEDILSESIDFLTEATRAGDARMAQRRATRERQSAESSRTSAEKEANTRDFARRDADSAARARRAARASMVRGALSGAKRSVKGALSSVNKQIRDKKTQLKQGFSTAGDKAKAALSRVARGGRRAMNAVKGGVQGAKIGAQVGYNYPLPTSKERAPVRMRMQNRKDNAKAAVGEPFAKPPARTVVGSYPGKTSTVVGTYPGRTQPPAPPKAPAKPRTFGSAKSRARMAKTSGAYEAAKQKLNASVDYDLLTQYMIEDLINEGYAESELQAVSILEDMTEQNLNEFANLYLQD
jgi:hypothetical protein